MITADGDYEKFLFRPEQSRAYVFEAKPYRGGAGRAEHTYLKLYARDTKTPTLLANAPEKLVLHLQKGKTYELHFSGYLMQYAKARINARQGETVSFQKRTDANFIFVNSPEFITRADIVDDECHEKIIDGIGSTKAYTKLFEEKYLSGKILFMKHILLGWGKIQVTIRKMIFI